WRQQPGRATIAGWRAATTQRHAARRPQTVVSRRRTGTWASRLEGCAAWESPPRPDRGFPLAAPTGTARRPPQRWTSPITPAKRWSDWARSWNASGGRPAFFTSPATLGQAGGLKRGKRKNPLGLPADTVGTGFRSGGTLS